MQIPNTTPYPLPLPPYPFLALTHADSEVALDTWYRTAKSAEWQNLVELREAYPSADLVDINPTFRTSTFTARKL